MNDILQAALELAAQGYACFPCNTNKLPTPPRDKDPDGKPIDGTGGLKKATKDAAQLRDLWSRHGAPLIGVATGKISGIDVLDIDTARHPEATAWLEQNRARLPNTRMHQTGSGGLHLVFQHGDNLNNSAGKLCIGIDTRCNGGYAIWWPAAGLPVLCDAAPAPWPSWLLRRLNPPAPPPVARSRDDFPVPIDVKLRHIVRAIGRAREGERNNFAFWGCCRIAELVADGGLSRDHAISIAIEAASRLGLSRREAEASARSAFRTIGV
jgi:hypothetical protein